MDPRRELLAKRGKLASMRLERRHRSKHPLLRLLLPGPTSEMGLKVTRTDPTEYGGRFGIPAEYLDADSSPVGTHLVDQLCLCAAFWSLNASWALDHLAPSGPLQTMNALSAVRRTRRPR